MKFFVDAQLSKKLANWLIEQGFDTVHTLDLPDRNLTKDHVINTKSVNEKRIVISKDSDFYHSYILKSQPFKLVMITTGNITNKALLELIVANFQRLLNSLKNHDVIELSNDSIIIHY